MRVSTLAVIWRRFTATKSSVSCWVGFEEVAEQAHMSSLGVFNEQIQQDKYNWDFQKGWQTFAAYIGLRKTEDNSTFENVDNATYEYADWHAGLGRFPWCKKEPTIFGGECKNRDCDT